MATADALDGARALFDLDPERVRCPYPTFSDLRAHSPVSWVDTVEAYVVTSYDLITEVLRNPQVYSSRSATGPKVERQLREMTMRLVAEDPSVAQLMQGPTEPVLLLADPPEHTRQRSLINRAFTPATIRRLEDDIQALADELVQKFVADGRVELVSQFAGPLPMTVIATALGVPLDRMDDFKRWSEAVASGVGKRELTTEHLATLFRARFELNEFLTAEARARESEPTDDLLSQVVHATIDDQRLTTDEVVSMVSQILVAGNDTTAILIGTVMHHLAQQPSDADRLRRDPSLVPAYIEEMLRVEAPVNGIYRIATQDTELGGVKIPAESAVMLVYAAGSRDPSKFEQADEFCPGRSEKTAHLAFGFGAHYCVGASLARTESRIAIQTLLQHCGDIRLAVEPAEITYDDSFMIHAIRRLPLEFTPLG